jgi:hypothetical protein
LSGVLQKEFVDRIVEEVIYRLKELAPADPDVKGTVVLVTSFVPSVAEATSLLKGRFGEDITFIVFEGAEFPSRLETVFFADELGTDTVLKYVNESANIVLLTPRLKLIDNISQGMDDGFIEFLTIRSLLWGRAVTAVLDFRPPAFKRNTFYEKVAGIIDVLEELGISILSYDCSYEATEASELITESDVVTAWKNGKSELLSTPGGIVTPSARDKARELMLEIN